ncbi:MAG TPA: LacI family DNA-binding transcriptional regulator [Pedococcus sp.]|uniref:LacI family DNA-binding transcriptional regulator n=1 Tax=Pedococcus sp. TaxID=2860345 RepID=UPI002F95C5FC
MSPRPRAADVAQRAGVSVTAVSLVLNDNDAGNVSAATRARILAAAAELGYQPNRVAQSLRRQRTHVIGLVTDAIASSPFAGRLLGGAVERATRDGYVVVVFDSQDHPEREQAAADELANRQVDGLIYATMGLRELDTVPRTSLPLVLANCQQAGDPYPSVVPDDYRGGWDAARHLLGLGHRRITMLSGVGITPGQPHHLGNIAGPLRAKGFRAALRSHVAAADSPVLTVGWDIDEGYHGAVRVLAGPAGGPAPVGDRPTAIFAANDRVATGVLLAAARLGLDVPGDLSVVGFDDQEAVAANVVPALTTLALPHTAMGERAVELLLETVTGRLVPDASRREHLRCPLVVRESAGPPR